MQKICLNASNWGERSKQVKFLQNIASTAALWERTASKWKRCRQQTGNISRSPILLKRNFRITIEHRVKHHKCYLKSHSRVLFQRKESIWKLWTDVLVWARRLLCRAKASWKYGKSALILVLRFYLWTRILTDTLSWTLTSQDRTSVGF